MPRLQSFSSQVALWMYVLACMHSAARLLHPPSAQAPDVPPRPCCTFIPPLPLSVSQQDMSEEDEEERRREQQQSVARGYVYEPAEPHAEGGWQLLGPADATAQWLPWEGCIMHEPLLRMFASCPQSVNPRQLS